MRANYHTHSFMCGHGYGELEEYILEAIRLNMEEIGMSEHVPLPEKYDRHNPRMRMHIDKLEYYFLELERLREKYKNQIKILIGSEAEYYDQAYEDGYYHELLKRADYLILAQHFIFDGTRIRSAFGFKTDEEVLKYSEIIVKALDKKIFKFIAHPDVFMNGFPEWNNACEIASKNIIKKATELGVPLEVNCNGIRLGLSKTKNGASYKYPRTEFWEIVSEHNSKVIINTDAHEPEQLGDFAITLAKRFCEEHKLNLIDKLDF